MLHIGAVQRIGGGGAVASIRVDLDEAFTLVDPRSVVGAGATGTPREVSEEAVLFRLTGPFCDRMRLRGGPKSRDPLRRGTLAVA